MINLLPAYAKAKEELSKTTPVEVSQRTQVAFDQIKSNFLIPFLGKEYLVSFPEGEVTTAEGDEVPLVVKICHLHYLTKTGRTELTNQYISFKELPNGSIYIQPFNNRAIRPLVAGFASKPETMIKAGEHLGGRRVEIGDYAVKINIYPKIPITFVIWEGDEEFEASGGILYDSSAKFHLDTEDYALLPGLVIQEMKKAIALHP
ncbi:MAG: DUF3786 domain-containing protein [Peptococcaceae bacterium]|nr:DUF3786 domain-containing protein [Peptococcaceae bacterium]